MIKRNLYAQLKNHRKKREISLLIGARQVGKTTLMQTLQKELESMGDKTLFLSLDFERDKSHFESQENLIRKLELELGKGGGVVFIDEIQRKEDAGLFLKGIYDKGLPYKFVVSGSGSVELKEKVHESLAGRKRLFELFPVTFEEFVLFKTNYRYENQLEPFFLVEKKQTNQLLDEYLNFGGYPRVVLEEKLDEKIKTIDEIYRSYLERDVAYLIKVEKMDAFSSLVKLLASQTGQLLNYSEIASVSGLAIPTIKNYLWTLEKTYILQRLLPFSRNTRKEISKSPTIYFYDLGLRNYALNLFGNLSLSSQQGFVFQNFVFDLLRLKCPAQNAQLHFWRTNDKSEVDFVLERGTELIPVEVKLTLSKPQVKRSLRGFIDKYKPKKAYVVSKEYQEKIKINGTEVCFIPYWKWVAENDAVF